MKKYYLLFFKLLWITSGVLFTVASCSKNDGGDNEPLVPTDLKIEWVVKGVSTDQPYGDGSGIVTFSLSAKDATKYKILIDQDVIETDSGVFEYKCKNAGINHYTVFISAYNGTKFVSDKVIITVYVKPSLLWSDEFDYSGSPDPKKWTFEIGNGSNGWGNSEKQYYTSRPENAVVENGVLKIKTRRESYQGFEFTSARMITRDFFSFRYGIIEFRAKLPAGKGTWPALWMLGNNLGSVGWPACGEIDVMEHVGNQLNKIHGTLHYPEHSGANGVGGTVMVDNVTTDFHVYKAEWSAESVKFFVDDKLYYTFSNSVSVPFNHPFFIIMNCAMGGNFGGYIDPSFTQSVFEIDYVRVYQ